MNEELREKENELFICDCHSPEHQFILSYDEDLNIIYMHVHIINYQSFFKRLIVGIKYAFGYRCMYGEFDEVILNPSDKERLIKVINNLKTK